MEKFQSMEQKRSNYAFEKIQNIKNKNNKELEKKVSTIIGKLASLILTNGLGNTLAFLFAKGKPEHLEVIYMLSDWLINHSDLGKKNLKINSNGRIDEEIKKNTHPIIETLITKASVEEYIYYTDESIRLINWLRRFSDALLEKGDENE